MCSFDCLGLHSFLSFVKSSADSDVMAPLFDVVLDVDAKIKTIGKIYIERLATQKPVHVTLALVYLLT